MTAVEWLQEQITTSKHFYNLMEDINSRSTIAQSNIFEQAKEMEKEQIMDAYYDGKGNGINISHPLSRTKEISAEQYYNETFKSE